MSDVCQFIRELLDGHPQGTGIEGLLTHAVRIPLDDPQQPELYDIQIEVGGYTYTGCAFVRSPAVMGLDQKIGIMITVTKPGPGQEGYPAFLCALPTAPDVVQAQPLPPPLPPPPPPPQVPQQQQSYYPPQPQPATVIAPPYPTQNQPWPNPLMR